MHRTSVAQKRQQGIAAEEKENRQEERRPQRSKALAGRPRGRRSTFARSSTEFATGAALSQGQVRISSPCAFVHRQRRRLALKYMLRIRQQYKM